jgi:hypothetical protein
MNVDLGSWNILNGSTAEAGKLDAVVTPEES